MKPYTEEELKEVMRQMKTIRSSAYNLIRKVRTVAAASKEISVRDVGVAIIQYGAYHCRVSGLSKRETALFCMAAINRAFDERIKLPLEARDVTPNTTPPAGGYGPN